MISLLYIPSCIPSLHPNKYFQQTDVTSPPMINRSGQLIKYSLPTNYSLIGYDAPSLADVAASKKRKMTSTKRTAQKTQGISGHTLAIASAPNVDAPTDAVSSPSEGNRQLSTLFPDCNVYFTDHIIRHSKTQLPKIQMRKTSKRSFLKHPR